MFCVVFIVLERVIYVRPSEAKKKSIKKKTFSILYNIRSKYIEKKIHLTQLSVLKSP